MAVLEGGSPTIIVNAEGDRTTPSVVGFRADGDRVVGKAAKNQAVTNPKNTVFSIKRFMGRRYDECTSELKTVPYNVKSGTGNRAGVEIEAPVKGAFFFGDQWPWQPPCFATWVSRMSCNSITNSLPKKPSLPKKHWEVRSNV